jgi:hypothetical protein
MNTFIERHADQIRGVLSCFDRVVLTGTLPDLCHAGAMATYLGARQIRLFDYPRWAEPFRDEIRVHAERLAREAGLTIEFIRRLSTGWREEAGRTLLTCYLTGIPGTEIATRAKAPGEQGAGRSGMGNINMLIKA